MFWNQTVLFANVSIKTWGNLIIIMCNFSMQIRLGKLNVNYCVCVKVNINVKVILYQIRQNKDILPSI